jgi:selenocysteine-specific elongation factor
VTEQRSIILGTAGHIDHGKTALVKALTGIDTDRLKEERRRGITIELGFAHLRLVQDGQGGETLFGVVDVPGHERFIKSMVAGAGGIDLVMLVVAADEGVMPQTREHLDICQLLGVQRGCVALTKADLAEPDWLELVVEDVRQTIEPTFLRGAPIVPCSAVTGAGLDRLREVLLELAATVRPRDAGGLLRLPLDRVFTIKGFGTVVTGTLLSGTLRAAEEVAILPTELRAKVRSVQVHNEEVPLALAGQRTAVNLGGVDRQEVSRGEVLVHPGTLAPSTMIDTSVTLLASTRRPLSARSKVLFHIGTRQQEATCVLPDRPRLEPGEQALAQLHFDAPVVALPGDRFILRGFHKQESYGTTIGGGTVLRVLSRRIRPKHTAALELLRRVQAAHDAGDRAERVGLELLGAGPAGLTRAQLQQRLPFVPAELERILRELRERRAPVAVLYDAESGATVHAEHLAQLAQRTREILDAFHRDRPLEAGIGREELRSRLGAAVGPRLFATLLTRLEREGTLTVERETCRLASHTVQTAARSIRPLADRVRGAYERAGLGPPRDGPLAGELGVPADQIAAAIKLLVEEGTLVRVADLYFSRQHLEDLRQRLVAFLQQEGQITPPQFKELVGQSRKFTIPLAEYFDAQKVTLRIGDLRKLRG